MGDWSKFFKQKLKESLLKEKEHYIQDVCRFHAVFEVNAKKKSAKLKEGKIERSLLIEIEKKYITLNCII